MEELLSTENGVTEEDAKSDVTESQDNTEPPIPENDGGEQEGEIDYEALIAEDLTALRSEFPELAGIEDITELDNPIRYAALRDMGLTAEEAYLATRKRVKRDNRSHLTTAYGRSGSAPRGGMSQRELSEARELFSGLSDSEIQRLYRKVTT